MIGEVTSFKASIKIYTVALKVIYGKRLTRSLY